MYYSKSIHNCNRTDFPQNSALFAMVCHLKEPCKDEIFNTPFHVVSCRKKKNLTGIFNVKHTKYPLSCPTSNVSFNSHHLPVDCTGRQYIEIAKTLDICNAALQRLFRFLLRTNRPETASNVVGSITFQETVMTSDTKTNLLLNISCKPGSGCTQTKEKTEQENDAENEGETEDNVIISGHAGLFATGNGDQIEAHMQQHFGQPTSAYSDQPDSELQFATEHKADKKSCLPLCCEDLQGD